MFHCSTQKGLALLLTDPIHEGGELGDGQCCVELEVTADDGNQSLLQNLLHEHLLLLRERLLVVARVRVVVVGRHRRQELGAGERKTLLKLVQVAVK